MTLLQKKHQKDRLRFAKTLLFGDMSCGLMRLKLNCLTILTIITFGGGSLETENIMVAASWSGGVAAGSGEFHKIDSFTRKEHYVEILKQHLQTSTKFKLGSKWVFR